MYRKRVLDVNLRPLHGLNQDAKVRSTCRIPLAVTLYGFPGRRHARLRKVIYIYIEIRFSYLAPILRVNVCVGSKVASGFDHL